MTPKKSREPRKPLNQSFIDFVHGNLPPEALKPSAEESSDDAANANLPAIATELHQELRQELRQELQVAIASLQTRLEQLETAPQAEQEPALGPIKTELSELLKRLQSFEFYAQAQYSELCDRIADLEQLKLVLPTLAAPMIAPIIASTEAPDPQKETPIVITESAFETLVGRFDQLEQRLQDQWVTTSDFMHRIEADLGTLNQELLALRETLQNSSTIQIQSVRSPEPTDRLSQPLNGGKSNAEPPSLESDSSRSNAIAFIPVADSATTDPLIHRLSALLDAF